MLRPTSVNLPGGIRRTTETRSVENVLLPFIRARKVFFKMEGLLPNMRHRPYFDGVDVSDWCREEVFQFASSIDDDQDLTDNEVEHPEGKSSLISDSDGVIEGSFFVPNTSSLRFRAGRREFKVLDWNSTADSNAISKAYAAYTAQGTLETLETTVTTIFPAPPLPPPVVVRPRDPVAQSFIIEKAEGAYITAADVFMQSKASNVPLQIEIRPMVNGSPTNAPVPGASVFIKPADVNISESPSVKNAATITRGEFAAPVYLEGFIEYALVVLAESDDYNIWTAVTTEFVNGSTTRRITKQPAMGSFFKSQNGSTWTPDQSRDMMFRVHRAVFDTSGTAYIENVAVPYSRNVLMEVLEVGADPRVRVYAPNHGLYEGSTTEFAGGITRRGIGHAEWNTTHVVDAVSSADSFDIVMAGSTSTSLGIATHQNIRYRPNIQWDTGFLNANQLVLSKTNLNWSMKAMSGRSFAGQETPYIKSQSFTPIAINDNIFTRNPQVVANSLNQGATKALSLKVDISTSSDYVSPIIDLSRLSMNLISNRVDNQAETVTFGFNTPHDFVAETDPRDGTSLAKHLFETISLEQPATGIKMLLGVNRPPLSEIDVYYRTVASGSDAVISQLNWVKADIDQIIQPDDDPNIFREYEYTVNDIDAFDIFQIKLVFRSQNTSTVPRVRDFRAIALGT